MVAITIDNSNLNLAHSTATVTFTFSASPVSVTLADTSAVGGALSNLSQVNPTTYTATFTAGANTDIANPSVSVSQTSPITFSSAVATFYEVENNWVPSQMIDGDFRDPNGGINGWSVYDFSAGMAELQRDLRIGVLVHVLRNALPRVALVVIPHAETGGRDATLR